MLRVGDRVRFDPFGFWKLQPALLPDGEYDEAGSKRIAELFRPHRHEDHEVLAVDGDIITIELDATRIKLSVVESYARIGVDGLTSYERLYKVTATDRFVSPYSAEKLASLGLKPNYLQSLYCAEKNHENQVR